MTARVYDATVYRWKQVEVYEYSTARSQWEPQRNNPKAGMQTQSHMVPGAYLGANTVWARDVSNMPLHTQSAIMASYMWTETPTRFNSVTGNPSGAFGAKTSLNTSTAGTHPIVSCVVDSSEPGCNFITMDSVSGPGMSTAEADAMLKGNIPWPGGLLPPTGGDKAIMIFDLNTGITREYFNCVPVTNKPGHFTASVGGYSISKPYYEGFGTDYNYATQYRGSNAVVRMHNVLGQIGIDEVRQGRINHALGFTMANAIGGVEASWPALASDGKFPPASWSGWAENGGGNGAYPGPSPRHGQWGKLPSTVNPLWNPRTSLPYNPLTQLLIKAAQNYGLVGTDTNAWCHSFNTESGNREKLLTGTDPWTASGELATLLAQNSPSQSASAALDVSDFPWDLTQWAPYDWGRPNPDFMLRAGENFNYAPYAR